VRGVKRRRIERKTAITIYSVAGKEKRNSKEKK
jgi:hypothetical protein